MSSRISIGVVRVLLGLMLLLGACGGPSKPVLVVGSKNFTEQLLLGELLAQHLEASLPVQVERKLNLGGLEIVHQAMLAGQVDLYPEYYATAAAMVLREGLDRPAGAIRESVRAQYQAKFQFTWLPPLGFNNSFAMVADGTKARGQGITKLSQASKASPGWKLGMGYEFASRADGLPKLQSVYGLPFAQPPKSMDLSLLLRALADKQVDLVAANATDGMLSAMDVVILEDDRQMFPSYEAGVVVRQAALQKVPGLEAALAQLNGRVSDAAMRKMNFEVDSKGRSPKQVAADFLRSLQLPPR